MLGNPTKLVAAEKTPHVNVSNSNCEQWPYFALIFFLQ